MTDDDRILPRNSRSRGSVRRAKGGLGRGEHKHQHPAQQHESGQNGSQVPLWPRAWFSWTSRLTVNPSTPQHSEATISISNKYRLARPASLRQKRASASILSGAITRQRSARPAVLWPCVPQLLLLGLTRWRRFCTISMALQCSPADLSGQGTADWASADQRERTQLLMRIER